MRNLIYILAFLFSLSIFSQGGPKVDVIKFRGEVTTTVRNTIDVPVGETYLIYNVTTDRIEIANSDDVWSPLVPDMDYQDIVNLGLSGDNLTVGITNGDSDTVDLSPLTDGSVKKDESNQMTSNFSISNYSGDNALEVTLDGADNDLTLVGGSFTNQHAIIMGENGIRTIGQSISDINAIGNNAIITKEYLDGIVLGSSTDDQNASEVPYTDTYSIGETDVQGAIDYALKVTDTEITSTTFNPSSSYKTQIVYLKNLNTITVNEPTGTFNDGDYITYVQDSTGVVEFSFEDVKKGVKYKSTNEGAVILTHYTGSGWTFICQLCQYYTNYPYTTSNAWNTENESNAATGFVLDSGTATVTSVTTGVTDGTYALKFDNTTVSGGAEGWRFDSVISGVQTGDTVTITVDGYETGTGNVFVSLSSARGWDVSSTSRLTDTSQEHTIQAVATMNGPSVSVFGGTNSEASNDAYLDNLRITVVR